jgi:hypothetical protein
MDSSFGQVKPDYKIGICCFSAKQEVLWSKSKHNHIIKMQLVLAMT